MELPGELAAWLRQMGANRSLFAPLLAGWQVLLWRLSGNADPVTMVSAALQGQGASMLPIRAAIDPEMAAGDYVQTLEAAIADAYEHKTAAYDSIVREIFEPQEPGGTLLSEIQFSLEESDEDPASDSREMAHVNGQRAAHAEVFIHILDTGAGLRLACDYNTGLYDRSTIDGWLACYCALLSGMVADPLQSVATLPLLQPGVRRYLLEECNATATGPLPASSVPELIAAAFAAMPSRAAADFYGMEMTRAQLAEKSDRLAAWLLRHGAGPGSLAGIYMDRSLEMLVAMVGVMKAGAAYVPLDPMFPRARIEQIVEETKAPVLLTLMRHGEELPQSDAEVLYLDGEWLDGEGERAAEPAVQLPEIAADARAYVMFTSGSTGRPKGVEVTHGSVVNLLTDVMQRLEIGHKDRLLAVTTLSFDISVLEMLLPLVSGGTVVIAQREDAGDGVRLLELLAESRATVMQATPVTWRMLLELGFEPRPGFKMMCGGEAWTPAMAEKLLAGGSRLWNMYGPTETTVWPSITEVNSGAERITIGPPIANTRFYVLDARLQPVPPGVPGELWIAGAGVARGYFGREELTAERFLADPFMAGERMYRTGDEVRQLADGRIEFLGRLDQQVKLRGFRIELGEVETAIRALPEVRDAVVVLRYDTAGEAALAGYYTGGEGHTVAELRQALHQRLPAYMVPKVMMQLASLPLTPNGKVDRRALPAPERRPAGEDLRPAGAESGQEPVAEVLHEGGAPEGTITRSHIEQALLRIWRKIFETEDVSAESDFFDLGGDSLLLVKLQSAVAREFSVRFTTADIFRQPTLGAFAGWLEETQFTATQPLSSRAANPRVIPIQTAEGGRPLMVISQSMIFRTLAQELGPEQPVYALQMLDEDMTAEMESASFEQLAGFYCGLIREVQPEGPYRLAGWCVSGWLAYEVARQLEQMGEEIELLMIMDAWAPGYWDRPSQVRRMLRQGAFLVQRLGWGLRRIRQISLAQKREHGEQSLQGVAAAARKLPAWLQHWLVPAVEMPEVEEMRPSERVANNASVIYEATPIRGTVMIFNSEEQPTGPFLARDMGWAQVVGRPVPAYLVPGDHQEMFDKAGSRIMAARAREALGLG